MRYGHNTDLFCRWSYRVIVNAEVEGFDSKHLPLIALHLQMPLGAFPCTVALH